MKVIILLCCIRIVQIKCWGKKNIIKLMITVIIIIMVTANKKMVMMRSDGIILNFSFSSCIYFFSQLIHLEKEMRQNDDDGCHGEDGDGVDEDDIIKDSEDNNVDDDDLYELFFYPTVVSCLSSSLLSHSFRFPPDL